MRRLIVLFSGIALWVSFAAVPTSSASAAAPSGLAAAAAKLPIEGYLMDADGALGHLQANAAAITTVGVDGVSLTNSGARLTATPDITAAVIAQAHRSGLKAELLVSNYSESLGDFSPRIAGRLLTSASHRKAVAKALAARITKAGYDGVQLDLESLKPSHGNGLTAFVTQLRKALRPGKRISMAVMASEGTAGYRAGGYQLAKLSRLVDRFVLMAYDQHGPGWSEAGPVGGTPWVKRVLAAFAAAGVPRARIDLGVAQYGYRWPADGSAGSSLSVAQARALAGDRAHYDAVQQEWTATLTDATVLWWSDKDTFAARRELALAAGIHGMAVWELSLCDVLSPS